MLHQYRRLQDCEQQVEHLLELKKAHLKAVKKQQAQAMKTAGARKKRTWKPLSRTTSNTEGASGAQPDDDADDEGEREEDEEEEEEDSLTQIERTDSMQEVSVALNHCH